MTESVKTIADIAKLAGVSKSTVSRALNDNPLINEETRERIKAIAREHQFEVHQGARCLSLNRSNTIALIIPIVHKPEEHLITDPFFVELLRGIMYGISGLEYDLLIGQPRKHDPNEIQRYVGSKRADGLIIIGCHWYIKQISVLNEHQNFPIIAWGGNPGQNICSVDCDNVTGGRLAVGHLLKLGRKRIAFIGGTPDESEVIARYQGYVRELQNAGFEVDPKLVAYGDYTSRAGYEQMLTLLQQNSDIDGVFACSDLMAIGVMEALREQGRQVPRDVSVVGFDDIPLAEHCSPPLTTIRQNIAKAGEVLVRNLVQYLTDGIITRTILPVELVIRKSSVFEV